MNVTCFLDLLDFGFGFGTVAVRGFFLVLLAVFSSSSVLFSSSSSSSSVVGAARLNTPLLPHFSLKFLLRSLLFIRLAFRRRFLRYFLHFIPFEIRTNRFIESILLSTDLHSNREMFFNICQLF